MTKKVKNRLPPFTPLLHETMDSPAWRATSHGAKALYIALKRPVPIGRNTAFLSYRDAHDILGSSIRLIAEWFDELEPMDSSCLHVTAVLASKATAKLHCGD